MWHLATLSQTMRCNDRKNMRWMLLFRLHGNLWVLRNFSACSLWVYLKLCRVNPHFGQLQQCTLHRDQFHPGCRILSKLLWRVLSGVADTHMAMDLTASYAIWSCGKVHILVVHTSEYTCGFRRDAKLAFHKTFDAHSPTSWSRSVDMTCVYNLILPRSDAWLNMSCGCNSNLVSTQCHPFSPGTSDPIVHAELKKLRNKYDAQIGIQ